MATLNTTDVIACMFKEDVTITLNSLEYPLPANTAIGIPDSLTSLVVNIVTTAMCMTSDNSSTRKRVKDLDVLFIDELRLTIA